MGNGYSIIHGRSLVTYKITNTICYYELFMNHILATNIYVHGTVCSVN